MSLVAIKSRYLLPITSSPIKDGVLLIKNGIITAVGDLELLNKQKIDSLLDYSTCDICPGFINAHAHLELTAVGPLPAKSMIASDKRSFAHWVETLVSSKNKLEAPQIKEGYLKGVNSLLKTGVTTVLDQISYDFPIEILAESVLPIIPNAEVLGVLEEVAQSIYEAILRLKSNYQALKLKQPFLMSPHALYSINPTILDQIVSQSNNPLFIHIAESQDEVDYFRFHTGPLAEFIKNKGVTLLHEIREDQLEWLSQRVPEHTLIHVVHGNYLTPKDVAILKKKKWGLIHCPGSHAYFKHQEINLKNLLLSGVTVALGTDSLASNTELSFLAELKQLRQRQKELTADDILTMATLNGAKLLNKDAHIGSLEVGKEANFGVYLGHSNDPAENIIESSKVDHLYLKGIKII